MWNAWTEKAKEALEKTTVALESTGEAIITQAATVTKSATITKERTEIDFENELGNVEREVAEASTTTTTTTSPRMSVPNIPKIDKDKMMNMWSSVVETTKRAAEDAVVATKDVVETSRSNIERQFHLQKGFYKRDIKLPIDVEALRDAEVVYITDRIITMSHPTTPSKIIPAITAERKLAAIGHLLDRRHDGRYLCWNLSEVDYDISILNHQVLTFSFPGSPSPPLGLLLKLLLSLENWMKADERNVAVVHCLTGKGRTSTILACFLSWIREAGFGDVNEALTYIAKCKQVKPDALTIPSQRRYATYFHNMLDGVRPSQTPLMLKRIIMSEAPRFAKGPQKESVQVEKQDGEISQIDEQQLMGCAPYIQIFKAGKLIHTSAASLHVQQSEEELPFVQVMDGTVPFNINQIIQGDILIRCRHLTFERKRVSMFRAAFHTGYVPPNVLRLIKTELDGACADKRYANDFFLDLIFEKADPDAIARHEKEKESEEETKTKDASDDTDEKGKGPVVKASNFDSMLQGDSRFWDVIASKKKEHSTQSNDDPFWGPTVGRRRGDSAKQEAEEKAGKTDTKERTQLETFSIGNEFDFVPDDKVGTQINKATSPKRDSLMDALNALDEDEGQNPDAAEEIVFDSAATKPIFNDTNTPVVGGNGKIETEKVKVQSVDKCAIAALPESSTETNEQDEILEDVDDMDALLASADDDFDDLDLADFDDDDDLEDLENMLKQ